jgi:hypothetical protein
VRITRCDVALSIGDTVYGDGAGTGGGEVGADDVPAPGGVLGLKLETAAGGAMAELEAEGGEMTADVVWDWMPELSASVVFAVCIADLSREGPRGDVVAAVVVA